MRHPNDVAVFVELLALPLVHTAWLTALGATALHAIVLRRLAGAGGVRAGRRSRLPGADGRQAALRAEAGARAGGPRRGAARSRWSTDPELAERSLSARTARMNASAATVIAGGGPAGAALAILAGRAGFSVAIFYSARSPLRQGVRPMPAAQRRWSAWAWAT